MWADGGYVRDMEKKCLGLGQESGKMCLGLEQGFEGTFWSRGDRPECKSLDARWKTQGVFARSWRECSD